METAEEVSSEKSAPRNLFAKMAVGLWLVTLLVAVGGGAYWFGTRSVKVSPVSSISEPEIIPTSASSLTEAVTGTPSSTGTATATPTATPNATATPTPSPSPSPTGLISRLFGSVVSSFLKVGFTASYQGHFTCVSMRALSFRIVNTESLDLESWKMRVEGPVGTVLNSYTDMNNHFRHVAGDCTSPGYPKIAPGESAWIYMSVPAVPSAGTPGKAVIKMCSQDTLAGTCKEVTVNFIF